MFRKILLCLCIAVPFSFVPVSPFATEQATIAIGSAFAELGGRVNIPITLEANPGIAYLRIAVEYDASRLRIDNVNAVSRGVALNSLTYIGVSIDTYRRNPFRVLWYGSIAGDDISTGSLLNIEFTVLEDAPIGEAEISVYVGHGDALGRGGAFLTISIAQGGINVLGEEIADEPEPTLTPPVVQEPVPMPTPPPIEEQDDTPTAPPVISDVPPAQQQPPTIVPDTSQAPSTIPDTIPGYTTTPPTDTTHTSTFRPLVTPIMITPQHEEVEALPPAIQALVADSTVFFTEHLDEYEESMRVLVSVPYAKAHGVMLETLVAYRLDPHGEIELIIPSLYDVNQSAIRLLGYTGELYMVASNLVEFIDVAPDRWYHRAVTFVAARGVFSGVGNNLFAPQTTMTRSMFITALSRLDGINDAMFGTSPFADVNIAHWYGPAIAWASSEGIIDYGLLSGNASGTFRPNDNITREEMALIFANYLVVRDFPLVELNAPIFYDLHQASPWAREAIQSMRSHSIIAGLGNNLYNPRANATRAEVAQIFANLVRAIVGLS